MPVIIGMDPHKRSATIEVINEVGDVLMTGSPARTRSDMPKCRRPGADSVTGCGRWKGCDGVGRHIAHRLVHDGETVLDVPTKLSAQVRVFATGNGRKTDPVDAHSVALAALRAPDLTRVQADPELVVMTVLVDRRDELGRARTQTVDRLHRLQLELFPGGAKELLSAAQARALVATIKPRHRGQDPTSAGGRAHRGAGNHRQEDQGCGQRSPRAPAAGSGGRSGTTLQSSVAGLTPDTGPSDKPQPEPATGQPTPARATP